MTWTLAGRVGAVTALAAVAAACAGAESQKGAAGAPARRDEPVAAPGAPAPGPAPAADAPAPHAIAAPSHDAGAHDTPPPADARAETLHLAFAGDVMFGRFIEGGFRPIEAEEDDPFDQVAHLLDSDFTMVNLETPIMREPLKKSPWGTRMRFVTSMERVATLARNNVDAVTIANNHAFDVHHKGLRETPQILDDLGLRYIGAHRRDLPKHRAETIEVNGWKIAFIPATTEANWEEKRKDILVPHAPRDKVGEALVPVVKAARPDHDLVIVVLHWGEEYKDEPARWQVKAARAYIDAGADAVIAHHPHVLQGIERYKHGLIAYSLGNFLFDNLGSNRKWSGILHLHFRRDGACLERAAFDPTIGTRPRFHPAPAGKAWDTVAGRIQRLSAKKPRASDRAPYAARTPR
jgi:poly-gamma-glutamate synthesis protein (capsule biosynthesis protein)